MKVNNKKGSNTRKIIPAVGMLSVSAIMLASSTYAWFTMSREVEVTGIQMSATVPEDLQISLGTIGTAAGTPETAEGGKSLANGTGVLTYTSGSSASDGNVAPPTHTWDWSNSADISKYYAFGRLIPASSTTGQNIFYTPDATGVGKTVNAEGSYYQASNGLIAYATNDVTHTATASTIGNTSAKATLHAFTDENNGANDTWTDGGSGNYTQSADWKNTNDDGYYVDVPVWIRTSSNEDIKLSVDGYVLPGNINSAQGASNKETDLELYRAVRVAILNGTDGSPANATGNILPLKDAWDLTKGKGENDNYTAITGLANPWGSTKGTLDSDNLYTIITGTTRRHTGVGIDSFTEGTTLAGVSAADINQSTGADTVTKYYKGTYSTYTAYDPTSTTEAIKTIATVPGSTTSKQYGDAKNLIIRVWLDGEDKECWNDNAGQDWAISLKFSKIESNS